MLRIFVYDRDVNVHKDIGSILQKRFKNTVNQYEILYFQTPKELLQSDYTQCDVFCLDFSGEKNLDGLELAKIVRQKNYNAFIMFISSSNEKAYEAFSVGTFRYLLKPINEEQLMDAFDVILKIRRMELPKLITLQQGQKIIRIPYSEVIYFETVDRKLRAVTTKRDYLLDNRINELERQVMELNFFRIHKSYLINMAYVKEYSLSNVTMLNGDILFMSRLRCKEFKENYKRFLN